MRCVGKQLSGIVWHRLIRIDKRVRLRGWCDHVISQPALRFDCGSACATESLLTRTGSAVRALIQGTQCTQTAEVLARQDAIGRVQTRVRGPRLARLRCPPQRACQPLATRAAAQPAKATERAVMPGSEEVSDPLVRLRQSECTGGWEGDLAGFEGVARGLVSVQSPVTL